MLNPRRILIAAALFAISTSSFAAINNNAATYGQWRNTDGQTISVGADGVKQYADSADECRSMGYKMTGERFQGSQLISGMKSSMGYHQDILRDVRDAETESALQNNIKNIKRLLPLIKANQSYAGIAMQCGDGNNELIFIDKHNAMEQSFGGGETYYEHYRK